HRPVAGAGILEPAGSGHQPESGEQVDDKGRSRLRGRCAKPDQTRDGGGGGGRAGKERAGLVRVSDGPPHQLAGTSMSLPFVAASRVRLPQALGEAGVRFPHRPAAGRHPIRPWLAEVLPDAFPDWRCEVVALEVERSFWEKATILHTEYHRP